MTLTHDLQSLALARGILESVSDEKLILSLPGTEYRLHLVPTVPGREIATPIGKRIKGVIEGQALRIFKAEGGGGGTFIEPIEGAPRIVAGRVLAVDQPQRRILVNVAVPMWLTWEPLQPADMFAAGDLVNCYVESGARFTPV